MERIVTKIGNNLGIIFPNNFTNELSLKEGSKLNIVLNNNVIEISNIDYIDDLDTLLNSITNENKHSEFSTFYAVGNELC
jgi:antitoxin component of MazEF toxin-antitoxin module